MAFARRGIRMGSMGLLASILVLGACRSFFAEESPAPTAPPAESSSSFGESGTPDAPPANVRRQPAKAKQPPAPAQTNRRHPLRQRLPRAKAKQQPTQAPSAGDSSSSLFPFAGETPPVPEEEAPAIGGPSGFESATPEAAPSGADEERQTALEEEAPAIGGPSGGERTPAEAERGRYAPWWTRVPNVQPFPPPGNTSVPPRGAGYYTFWELLSGDRRQRPPIYPYPRFGVIQYSFFNADWRYLDNPDSRENDVFNFLKRIPLGENFMFTTGGEYRWRYNNQVNSRLSGKDNTFYLNRTRVFGDFWFRDFFRVYGEFISAESFDQDLPPAATDRYNANFLNLFADVKLATLRDQPLWLRGGRQELLYGSQRLISPLDWVNTRRTFQGAKLFWQNAKWSIDGFVTQPVVPSANSFASVTWQEIFSGLWGTYRPVKGEAVDFYYLDLQDSRMIYRGQNGVKGPQNVSTVGVRWYGDRHNWLWDAEGMVQFGRYSNQGIFANAYTMGGGYTLRDAPMAPTIWLYYDYASGDPNPGSGVHRTFNQLFPFGHYYFGMMDIVGRQNINDIHTDLSFSPLRWWTVWAQYHVLRLDSPRDALYNAAGVATRVDPSGRAGINVGEILTIVNNFTIDLHQNIFIQYSHLYAGDFLKRTGSGSADELYVMYSFRW